MEQKGRTWGLRVPKIHDYLYWVRMAGGQEERAVQRDGRQPWHHKAFLRAAGHVQPKKDLRAGDPKS